MKLLRYKIIDSTNSLAKKIAKEKKEKAWTIIWADEQSRGRGKEKRGWYSPRGGLYFSAVLPRSSIEDLQTLTILTAFIIAKVLKENFSLEPLIKLPNDIYIGKKKIAGVLTEAIIGSNVKSSIIGIGINTNIKDFPKDLKNIACSLEIILNKKVDNEKILKQIVKGLKKQFVQNYEIHKQQ